MLDGDKASYFGIEHVGSWSVAPSRCQAELPGFSPYIMCVQYRGGYHEYSGGVQYHGALK